MSLTKQWGEETGAFDRAEQDEQEAADWAKRRRRAAEELADQIGADDPIPG